ncbi:MAG: hypothetical protein UV95_C0004G0034 [Candidatus Falkowbacteria bacterium GW2011_GWF2_43_32]|jgi:hypothetical protein|nr:MAG: hypothetical protein UV95_C0004G0034 [Candidatus Falkowbacteria bacterium GW2011_GWF2_43_32]
MSLSKTCQKHRCFKRGDCRHKSKLGYLTLCRIGDQQCPYCSPNPYGRYQPEDVLLP